MLQDHKIIAFTPCGRKRYMDLLCAHMARQHSLGNVDEWFLFNNAYSIEDSTLAPQYAAQFPWIKVLENRDDLRDGRGDGWNWHEPAHISRFFKQMTEAEGVIYIRLDDDIVYIDDNCFPRLVSYRIANPDQYLIFPTIVNNVRTSYHMQQQGKVPRSWGIVQNDMNDRVAHKTADWPYHLHLKALAAIEKGTLVEELGLRSENYQSGDWESGRISINAFAMWGKDLVACAAHVKPDEESYLCWWQPRDLNRPNGRAGDALLVHFAYHTQTDFMDRSGMLTDYAKLAPMELLKRTTRLPPPPPRAPDRSAQPIPPPARRNQQLWNMNRRLNIGTPRRPTAPGPGMKA